MAASFPQYLTNFGRQDVLSHGRTGRIVVDRKTQTIIKWPVDAQTWRGIQQERAVYEKLNENGGHRGLLKYHGSVETYGLRLEYAAGSDLRSHIRYKGVGNPRELHWMAQIAQALEFIHDAGIIHGSVSLSHMMLDGRGNARLADFAWCALHSATLVAETLASHEYPGDRGTVQGDLFAFGSAMYELATGSEPFVTASDAEIRARFKRGLFPDVAWLGSLGDVIAKCWTASHENTKSVKEALEGKTDL